MIGSHITTSGPLFDGSADRIVKRNTREMDRTLGDEGVRRVHDRLHQVLRHPTGYYESRVVSTLRSDGADVTDSRVVYGPWLEGVGSRNQTTRFKGYFTFRLVASELDHAALDVVEPIVHKMVRELNGGD